MEPAFSRVCDAGTFVYGGGVAIFHLATARVVLCHYPRGDHWFLPKGRRDADEETREAAEREGFEESGYRNRILPLPVRHRQPTAYHLSGEAVRNRRYVREPVYTVLTPFGHRKPHSHVQYLVSYYIAETVPPSLEVAEPEVTAASATTSNRRPYEAPEPFPIFSSFTLADRVAMEPDGYEPIRHPHTGVDADELTYESHLLPVEEACARVQGTLHERVIREGWRLIQRRLEDEEGVRPQPQQEEEARDGDAGGVAGAGASAAGQDA